MWSIANKKLHMGYPSLSNLYGVRHVLVQRTRAEGRITGVASFGLIVKD